MKGAELVLRYFAFRHNRSSYQKPLSSFLDEFSALYRNAENLDLDQWTNDFNETLERVSFAFDDLAFRIFDARMHAIGAFNSALYDAQMIAFSETKNPKILKQNYAPGNLRKEALRLFHDVKFFASIRQATSDEQAVKTRIDTYKEFLDGF